MVKEKNTDIKKKKLVENDKGEKDKKIKNMRITQKMTRYVRNVRGVFIIKIRMSILKAPELIRDRL